MTTNIEYNESIGGGGSNHTIPTQVIEESISYYERNPRNVKPEKRNIGTTTEKETEFIFRV